ncbi:hypothetical protein SRHO_G00006970 [Serrasalmus rhombeus]
MLSLFLLCSDITSRMSEEHMWDIILPQLRVGWRTMRRAGGGQPGLSLLTHCPLLYVSMPVKLDTEALEDHTKNMKMGILEVVKESADPSQSLTSVVNVAVVLEEEVVMDNLPGYTNAFILLFGLLYALNIEYPKDLKYTFEVVQKVFLHLGNECTARVQSLKNKLVHM